MHRMSESFISFLDKASIRVYNNTHINIIGFGKRSDTIMSTIVIVETNIGNKRMCTLK